MYLNLGKISLLSLMLTICAPQALAEGASVYNCDANFYTDNGGGSSVSEVRKNDVTLIVDGRKVTFSQNSSNYTSNFIMQKDHDGSWVGYDSAQSYLIRHPNGYYSLSFSVTQMKNTIVIADSCKKVN